MSNHTTELGSYDLLHSNMIFLKNFLTYVEADFKLQVGNKLFTYNSSKKYKQFHFGKVISTTSLK